MKRKILKNTAVVFLYDKTYSRRMNLQMNIAESMIKDKTNTVTNVSGKGRSLMSRLFHMIMLGDYASVYLAMLNKVDPTPIHSISILKKRLKSIK
jgi:glucose/mannose-6-phosphate isomerase